ncbi:carboxypeptidase-like regulatory domain-containing protein [Hymenobacter tenuis]
MSWGQTGSIRGVLFNKPENKGFAYNATIVLPELKMGDMSDSLGHFAIKNIPIGIYEVEIYSPGYRDTTITSVRVVDNTVTPLNINFPIGCHVLNHENGRCPYCKKSDESIPIIYGFPNKRMMDRAKRNKVRLGGCQLTGCDPQWYCKRDEREF